MKNALWSAFEIAINYYQGFIMTYFVANFLSIYNKRSKKNSILISGFIYGSFVCILNRVTIFESIMSIMYLIVLFTYALMCFKDNIVKKLFASFMPQMSMLAITSAELNFFSSVFGITVEDLIVKQNFQRFITLLVIQISLFAAFMLLLKLFDYTNERFGLSDWLPVVLILLLSYVLFAILHEFSLDTGEEYRILINASYILIVGLNIFVLYLIVSLCKKNDKIRNLELFQLKEHYQKQYIDNANQQYESMRKMRHDMNDRLSAVYRLIKSDKIDEALEFISQNEDVLLNTQTYVSTDNSVVNAVINSKLTAAKALGIRVSCISVNHYYGIDDMDLCSLLSNMLENAVTACKESNSDNKRIDVKISCEGDVYRFYTANTIEESVLKANPKLSTTKGDKSAHGLGVKIIKEIAEKYNGRCDFFERNDMFCVSASLIANGDET